MSEQGKEGRDFEERLLARLKAVVAERGAAAAGDASPTAPSPGRAPRHRRPLRLALAGVAVLVVAALVIVLSSGGGSTSRAYAVEPLAGGGVVIRIYSLAEDTDGLEAELAKAGIPAQIDWLPAQTTCRERNLKPAKVTTSMGGRTGGFTIGGPAPALTIGVMSAEEYAKLSREFRHRVRSGTERSGEEPNLPNVSFVPKSFEPGQTLVIVGSPEPHGGDPEGGYRASVKVVEGPVEPCEPVPEAAATIDAIQLPDGAAGSQAAAKAAVPAAGQFLFRRTKVVQTETWEPGGRGTGPKDHPRHFTSRNPGPHGHVALVPTTKEVWTAPDGRTHVRETLGRIEFLSPADQRLWEAAGSPPPFEYDPAEHHVGIDAAGNPTKEFERLDYRGRHAFAIVPKLFALPTEAAPLRAAIEGVSIGEPAPSVSSENGRTTAERLIEILGEPETTPALAAAAFEALGELPGVRHEGRVTDAAGRSGEALGIEEEGFGRRVIFERSTSRVLAEAEMVFGPPSTNSYGVPAGTPYRETAYLGSAIVDSAGQIHAGEPGDKSQLVHRIGRSRTEA